MEMMILDNESELQPLVVRKLSTAVLVKQSDSVGGFKITRQMLRELLTAMDTLDVRDPDADKAAEDGD